MTNLADGHTAALRTYEREQAQAERVADRCAAQAEREMGEPVELADAIAFYDLGLPVAEALARCFRNLDAACRGETISQDAITTALHQLHRDLVDRRTATLVSEWEPE